MQLGLLYYEDDPKLTLAAKVLQAAGAYLSKHGRWPDTCYVHPGALDGQQEPATCKLDDGAEMRVLSAPYILRHHFWLGENNVS